MRQFYLILLLICLKGYGQGCQSTNYGCTATNLFPSGTFSTTSSSWQTVSPHMNAGNYTAFSVSCGSTYEWSYCGDFGGSQGFDAELTLFDQNSGFLCFQNNSGRTNCPYAPYLSWTATYSGIVYVLTSAATTVHCATNTGSTYFSTLVWRQSSAGTCGCTNWQVQPSNPTLPISGGSGSVTVYASGTCTYSYQQPSCSWLTVGFSGTQLTYSAGANCDPARSCTVNITSNGSSVTSFTVTQAGVTPPSTPAVSASPSSICTGQTSNLSVGNACTGCTYQWGAGCSPQSGTSTSVTAPGTYTVTASDNCGNSASASITVQQNSQTFSPTLTASPTAICPTGATSTLTVSNSGSCGTCTYQWSGGTPSGSSTSVNTPNTYSVTVTDQCHQTTTAAINVSSSNFNLTTPALSANPNTVCGSQTAQITVTNSTAYTGCTGCTYQWNSGTGSGVSTHSVTGPGTYTLTVTNTCGQSVVGQVTINNSSVAPAIPTITATPTSFCSGTGSLMVSNTSTCSQCSYAWSSGCIPQSGSSTTISAPGTYTVTVTNACTMTATAAITITANPTATISPANPKICPNGNIQLTATQGTAYTWSDGSNTQSITASNAGVYSVTVTNPASCTGSASATISLSLYQPPVAEAGAGQTVSYGSTVNLGGAPTAYGGASPYSYAWSGNVNAPANANPSAVVSDSATYCVTVTDAHSCTAFDCVHIDTGSCHPASLDHASDHFGPLGGIDTVHVVGQGGCPWTSSSSQSWISIIAGQNGSGSSPVVRYAVQPCIDNTDRTATITVAGQPFTVTQQCQCISQPVIIHEGGHRLWTDNISGATYQWQFYGADIPGATSRFYNDSATGPGVYTVIVCIGGCCSTVDYTTSASDLSPLQRVAVYPNPASEYLIVNGSDLGRGALTASLYDVLGKKVLSTEIISTGKVKTSLDISSLPAGVYELALYIREEVATRRITISK